jgi:DedD protein
LASALQNRLVGTIILVALAVIFLPDILDGKKQSSQDVFVELPQRPAMQDVDPGTDFPTERVKQAAMRQIEIVNDRAVDDPPQDEATVSTENVQQQASPAEVVQNTQQSNSQGVGWVIQLGSFRHQKNVRDLLDKLQGAGYRAFSRPVQTSSGELIKVFVGPDLQKDKLEKAVPHLKELTQLQGHITPFTVQ